MPPVPIDMSIFEKLRDVKPVASRFYVHETIADTVANNIGMTFDCAVALTTCAAVAMGMHEIYTGGSEAVMNAILRGNAEAAARIIGDGTVRQVSIEGVKVAYLVPGDNCTGFFSLAEREVTPDFKLAERLGVEGVRHVAGFWSFYRSGGRRYYVYAALFITKEGIGNRLALMLTPITLLTDAGYGFMELPVPGDMTSTVTPVGMIVVAPSEMPIHVIMGWDSIIIAPPYKCREALREAERVANIISSSPFLTGFEGELRESLRMFRG